MKIEAFGTHTQNVEEARNSHAKAIEPIVGRVSRIHVRLFGSSRCFCKVSVDIRGMRTLQIVEEGATMLEAIQRSSERLSRVVDRKFGQLQEEALAGALMTGLGVRLRARTI